MWVIPERSTNTIIFNYRNNYDLTNMSLLTNQKLKLAKNVWGYTTYILNISHFTVGRVYKTNGLVSSKYINKI